MELTIKNDKLIAHFAAEQEMKAKKTGEISDPVYGAWTVEHPETMLFGFLDSFREICEASKIEFDLTYSTIKNLAQAWLRFIMYRRIAITRQPIQKLLPRPWRQC